MCSAEKCSWKCSSFFAAFSLKMCLVICGRRQAVDHLGADLIFDLVLETVLLRTSNCISLVFLLYFSCIPASLYYGVALLLVSDCFIARLLGGGFTRLLSRRWWCRYVQCNVGFFANMRKPICLLIFANGFFSNMRKLFLQIKLICLRMRNKDKRSLATVCFASVRGV